MSAFFEHLGLGFGVAFSALNLLVAAIGSFIGTIVGVLPGLGPINGVAMLVPIAFAMKLPPRNCLNSISCRIRRSRVRWSYYLYSVKCSW